MAVWSCLHVLVFPLRWRHQALDSIGAPSPVRTQSVWIEDPGVVRGSVGGTANRTVLADIQRQLFSAIRRLCRQCSLSCASKSAGPRDRAYTLADLSHPADESMDSHHRHGRERRTYDCPLCFVPRLSRADKPTPQGHRGDSVCRTSCVHSFLHSGPPYDTQDEGWFGWVDGADLDRYDHRGEGLPRFSDYVSTATQAHDSAF